MLLALLLAAAAATCPPTWTYQNQAAWGGECPTGKYQSPIDIGPRVVVDRRLPPIHFNYKPFALSVLNTARYYEVVEPKESAVEIDGHSYELEQFHFHFPSEHRVYGVSLSGELHLVHEHGGTKVVVGVFIIESKNRKANPALEPIVKLARQTAACDTKRSPETFDPIVLIPKGAAYTTYDGSLTTPGCDGGVRWYVLTTPIYASRDQIRALAADGKSARRPVKPLNGRVPRRSVVKSR